MNCNLYIIKYCLWLNIIPEYVLFASYLLNQTYSIKFVTYSVLSVTKQTVGINQNMTSWFYLNETLYMHFTVCLDKITFLMNSFLPFIIMLFINNDNRMKAHYMNVHQIKQPLQHSHSAVLCYLSYKLK